MVANNEVAMQEAVREISGLMNKYAAIWRLRGNYAAQVEATNDLTEQQAGHLAELEAEIPKLFWNIMHKAYFLQIAAMAREKNKY